MPVAVRRKLIDLCDEALLRSIQMLTASNALVGIGRFAEGRIREICSKWSLPHRQMYLLHPSPQNPHANKHWTPTATRRFEELGLIPVIPQSESLASTSDADNAKRRLFQDDLAG